VCQKKKAEHTVSACYEVRKDHSTTHVNYEKRLRRVAGALPATGHRARKIPRNNAKGVGDKRKEDEKVEKATEEGVTVPIHAEGEREKSRGREPNKRRRLLLGKAWGLNKGDHRHITIWPLIRADRGLGGGHWGEAFNGARKGKGSTCVGKGRGGPFIRFKRDDTKGRVRKYGTARKKRAIGGEAQGGTVRHH